MMQVKIRVVENVTYCGIREMSKKEFENLKKRVFKEEIENLDDLKLDDCDLIDGEIDPDSVELFIIDEKNKAIPVYDEGDDKENQENEEDEDDIPTGN